MPCHTAAEGVRGFQHRYGQALPGQFAGRHQSRHTATDDNGSGTGRGGFLVLLPVLGLVLICDLLKRSGDGMAFAGRHGYGSTEWISLTMRVKTSGSVSGGTPCPRLST